MEISRYVDRRFAAPDRVGNVAPAARTALTAVWSPVDGGMTAVGGRSWPAPATPPQRRRQAWRKYDRPHRQEVNRPPACHPAALPEGIDRRDGVRRELRATAAASMIRRVCGGLAPGFLHPAARASFVSLRGQSPLLNSTEPQPPRFTQDPSRGQR